MGVNKTGKPMRLLLVSESYWPNADGGALFERRLVLGMIARGHHVAVWAPSTSLKSYDEADSGYIIHRERSVTFWANAKYKVSLMPFWHARQVIRREKPDVIHIHNCYWMGLSAMFWGRHYHIPVVATNHFMPENALMNVKSSGPFYKPLHRLIWAFLVWFHNRANFVTSPTPTAVSLLHKHGLKTPAKAISNGIDTSVFHPGIKADAVRKKYGIKSTEPVILYLGRLDGEKRIDLILDAMPAILKQQPAQLVLAGFGKSMDGLKAQAKKLGIAGEVIFTGYLDEADKPALYNAASLFVISSPAELQSIVTLEAMATGLPIVAVDVAALKELCHDGENGFLFTLGDTAGLAHAINHIIGDKTLAKEFSRESMNIVHEFHTTEVMFDSYENVYQQLIAKMTTK